ncbi:Lrp/AsnC family transcriptional regulator [Ponticoccus alexandrii]|uniref:Winged helix-turn-helix transcriptional regulator n=1 Tax=Ponticoccus alexandrii TaxID=1943633 RepID=A0ABX7FH16_9RHOB|nr:Lrp/AsnC family transcriptional regulator [Ponticoccus alexandrii]KID12390.1 AsnC family transcriptional regulator [Rhodobacteraceae bacterium PD-2]QRF69008.1 winged helix-turn-helix transcriptional regulator [Ponticoccus alexandrii]
MTWPKLDRIDLRILAELQRDARISIQDLSSRVGLSSSPCARRVRNLEKNGVIRGYTVVIDEPKMGFPISVFVSVKLDHQVDDRLRSFELSVRDFPEVTDCWLMTGDRDYLLRIAVADLFEFEHFLTGKLTKVTGVASLESSIPIRRVKENAARLD